jgi:biopolymer transport protein ExbD
MAKSKGRGIPEINAGSMADIAFLLLVFFLVTTTMDIPTGIQVALPPYSEEPPDITKQKKKEVLDVLVNSADMLLVKGEPLQIDNLKNKVIEHVNNNGRNPNYSTSPTAAIVSLKSDRGTSYNAYVNVYNELSRAYNEMRDEYSQTKFGIPYSKLTRKSQKEEVQKAYPKRISEAEPVDFGAGK